MKSKTVQMKIRIPVELHKWIQQQADNEYSSMNHSVCALIAKAKEAKEAKK